MPYGNHFTPATDAAIDAVIDGDEDPRLVVLTDVELQDVGEYFDRHYKNALMLGACHPESFLLERSMIINSNIPDIRLRRRSVEVVMVESIRRAEQRWRNG